MIAKLESLFLDHPRSVGESYLQHTGFALWFAGQLALAALAALVHAVLPFACEKTASRIVARLYERTHNRGG
jgi:hypothetical protein